MLADPFARYRVAPLLRSFSVKIVPGVECPFKVVFFVDGVECGSGQFQTAFQADDAGADFIFGGSL